MKSQSLNDHAITMYMKKYITYQWYQSRWFGVTDRITITKRGQRSD